MLGPIDLRKAIDNTIERIRDKSSELAKRIVLTSSMPSDLYVSADSRLLDEALGRVVLNALENSQNNVELTAERQDSVACIHVDDFGAGISAEIAESIFEPFTRFGNEDARQGIGLGLPIARLSMELMNGELLFHQAQERTRFTLRLPIASNYEI